MISTQRFFNQKGFDERCPCDNLALVRLSYDKIFQHSGTQWSTLRYVD